MWGRTKKQATMSGDASGKPDPAKSKGADYKAPGFREVKTTNVFRVVNFELFAKPNKKVMSLGSAAFLGCILYIVYMRVTDEHKGKDTYTAISPDGTLERRVRNSRWD